MITFKQFLKEDNNQLSTMEEAANIIKARCEKYLKLNTHLYRGINSTQSNYEFFEGTTRKNRIPKDMSLLGHKILNAYFKDQYGVAARSESLFTTPDDQVAARYGKSFEIFPMDDFDYLWSPFLDDAYFLESKTPDPRTEVGEMIFNVIRKLWPDANGHSDDKLVDLIYFGDFANKKEEKLKLPKLFEDSTGDREKILTNLFNMYGDKIYKFNTDIRKNKNHEVMLICDQFIAVQQSIADTSKFRELLS